MIGSKMNIIDTCSTMVPSMIRLGGILLYAAFVILVLLFMDGSNR